MDHEDAYDMTTYDEEMVINGDDDHYHSKNVEEGEYNNGIDAYINNNNASFIEEEYGEEYNGDEYNATYMTYDEMDNNNNYDDDDDEYAKQKEYNTTHLEQE